MPVRALKKQPLQARSQSLVDAVAEAAARVLTEEGEARLTTNRIAERAGVSIGSLYQYFENKEAILAFLFDRHRAEILAILDRAPLSGRDLRADLRAVIGSAIAAHQIDPALHAALTRSAPLLAHYVDLEAVRGEVHDRLTAFFAHYSDKIAPRTPDSAAFIAERTIEAVVHGAVVDAPHRLSDDLADDVALMLAGHFQAA